MHLLHLSARQSRKLRKWSFICLLPRIKCFANQIFNPASSIFKTEKQTQKTQWGIKHWPGRGYGFALPVLCLYDKAEAWHWPWKWNKLVYRESKCKGIGRDGKKTHIVTYCMKTVILSILTNIPFHSTIYHKFKGEQAKTKLYQIHQYFEELQTIIFRLYCTFFLLLQNAVSP